MDIENTNYTEIEQEFSRLLLNEKNRWIEMYNLLVVVEKNALWRLSRLEGLRTRMRAWEYLGINRYFKSIKNN